MNSVSRETSCPNPWHQSAPARRCQLCPECPWVPDAYRGCTFDLGVALPHLPACAHPNVHIIATCYLSYVEYMMGVVAERHHKEIDCMCDACVAAATEEIMTPSEWQARVLS